MPSNYLILCCPLLLGRCKLIISLKSVSSPQSPSDNRHTQPPQSVYIRISGGFRERNWKEVGQVVTGEEKQKKRIVPSFRSAGLAFGRESAERSGSPLIPRKHPPPPSQDAQQALALNISLLPNYFQNGTARPPAGMHISLQCLWLSDLYFSNYPPQSPPLCK